MSQHRFIFIGRVAKRTTYFFVTSVSITALCTLTLPTPTHAAADKASWAQGRILVKPKAGVSEHAFAQILNRHGARSVGKIRQISAHVVNVANDTEETVADALRNLEGVEYAEVDRLVPLELTANDPYFGSEWHLKTINVSTAWDKSTGDGITVAVLDSGINVDHPDLQGQVLTGWNSADQTTNYADIQGHGTKVAGTIAATTNNGTGVAAVAYRAKILPIRVTNDATGYAYWSDIARGLTWAADHGARVANISYDVTSSSAITSSANYMIGKGGLVTVSAGNGGAESTYADNKSLISVSATDSTDKLTSWSSYGNYIDVAAPGTNIYTTEYGGGYAAVAGTSFSSPIAASIIALIFAANPALTPAEAETILKSTATDLGTSGWDKSFGYGRVDADAAVTKALAFVNNPSPDTLAPTVSLALAADSTVTGTQAIDITASDNVGVSKVEVWIDDKLLGTDSSAPFSLSWNTTAVTNGSHIIKGVAFDSAGNQGTAQVTVNVNNTIVVDTVSPSVTLKMKKPGLARLLHFI